MVRLATLNRRTAPGKRHRVAAARCAPDLWPDRLLGCWLSGCRCWGPAHHRVQQPTAWQPTTLPPRGEARRESAGKAGKVRRGPRDVPTLSTGDSRIAATSRPRRARAAGSTRWSSPAPPGDARRTRSARRRANGRTSSLATLRKCWCPARGARSAAATCSGAAQHGEGRGLDDQQRAARLEQLGHARQRLVEVEDVVQRAQAEDVVVARRLRRGSPRCRRR